MVRECFRNNMLIFTAAWGDGQGGGGGNSFSFYKKYAKTVIFSGDQTQRQSPCSHYTPDWRGINHPSPSWSTVLVSVGMAHASVSGRGTGTGWCKSQGTWPHWAAPRDAASLGSPRGWCAPGFVLKNGQSLLAEVFHQNQVDLEIWWGSAQHRGSTVYQKL